MVARTTWGLALPLFRLFLLFISMFTFSGAAQKKLTESLYQLILMSNVLHSTSDSSVGAGCLVRGKPRAQREAKLPSSTTLIALSAIFFQASVHTKQKKYLLRKPHNTPKMHSRAIQSKQTTYTPILRNFLNNTHHRYSPFFT